MNGISGLKNIGNSCFFNSGIQCLACVEQLTKYFLNKEYLTNLNNNKYKNLITEYNKLINGMFEENCKIIPKSFYNVSMMIAKNDNVQFGFFNQNDVQEFLIFIIDAFHEGLKRKVNITITGNPKNDIDKMALDANKKWKKDFKDCYSKIVELFYGQTVTFIKVDGKVKSTTYNPMCFLPLPISNNDKEIIFMIVLIILLKMNY